MEEELCYIGSGNTHVLMASGLRSDTRIWYVLHNYGFINGMCGVVSQ
jgi:hypothetical protein